MSKFVFCLSRFSYTDYKKIQYWVIRKNEDKFLIDEKRRFCFVADGLERAAAGELASRIFQDLSSAIWETVAHIASDEVG